MLLPRSYFRFSARKAGWLVLAWMFGCPLAAGQQPSYFPSSGGSPAAAAWPQTPPPTASNVSGPSTNPLRSAPAAAAPWADPGGNRLATRPEPPAPARGAVEAGEASLFGRWQEGRGPLWQALQAPAPQAFPPATGYAPPSTPWGGYAGTPTPEPRGDQAGWGSPPPANPPAAPPSYYGAVNPPSAAQPAPAAEAPTGSPWGYSAPSGPTAWGDPSMAATAAPGAGPPAPGLDSSPSPSPSGYADWSSANPSAVGSPPDRALPVEAPPIAQAPPAAPAPSVAAQAPAGPAEDPAVARQKRMQKYHIGPPKLNYGGSHNLAALPSAPPWTGNPAPSGTMASPTGGTSAGSSGRR